MILLWALLVLNDDGRPVIAWHYDSLEKCGAADLYYSKKGERVLGCQPIAQKEEPAQ